MTLPSSFRDSNADALGRLVDRSLQPLLAVDFDGRIRHVNHAFEDLIGYRSEELKRLNVLDLTPLAWQPLSLEMVARVRETGQAVRYEQEYIRKDGSVVAVELAIDLDRVGTDEHHGTFAFVTDISARVHAEAERRESERRLRTIFNHSFQFIGLLTPDGTLLEANRASLDFVGVSRDDVVGKPFRDGPWWADSVEMQENLAHAIDEAAAGKMARFETVHTGIDGSTITVDFSLSPVFDADGHVEFLIPEGRDITERKQAEVAVQESEERFRTLYDEAPVGYHEIDMDGAIVSINHTECEMLGFSREEMFGRLVTDFVVPDHREQATIAIREKLQGLRPLRTLERPYVTRDGRRLIMSIDERYRLNDRGQIIGMRTTMQDVTERKRTEAALVASERRNRALFEGIEDAVFVHDLNGKILDANPAASRRLGYSREELLTLYTHDIDDPEFASGYEDRLKLQMERGHLSFEGRHRTKEGKVIPVEINTSTIVFEDQRGVLAVIRDITDRHALEETRRKFSESQIRATEMIEAKNRELVSSETRYRQLTEGAHDAVVVANEQGAITLFNPAAERTFGYVPVEALGAPLTMLMPVDQRSANARVLEHYATTRDAKLVGQTVELQGRRKNGEIFPLELSLSAFESDGHVQLICSIRDQTERQRMRAMLVQSEKLASIGLLSAGVAHEINNPLAYVGNNLAVLERDLKGVLGMMAAYESGRPALESLAPEVVKQVDALSEELDWDYVRQNLERMIVRTRDGVQRVATIVQSLRGLARTSTLKLEPALLRDLIGPAVEMIQGRGKRHQIEIVIDIPPQLRVNCVTSQISQVLLNLLVNAIQAAESANRPLGGKITVTSVTRDDMVGLKIQDTGCGIPAENLPKLFDPFFTTKVVGEGTGLGLSISHGIISGHGGRIEVESEVGVGTAFTILLPLNATGDTRTIHDMATGLGPEKG